MANFTVCVYVSTIILTAIAQGTTAAENKTSVPLEGTITVTVGGDSRLNKSELHCSNLYQKAFGCWQGISTLKEGDCATYDAEKKLVSSAN